MEYLLRAKGLWSVVEIGFSGQEEGTMLTEAQKGHLDDARLKDHQVKHYLFQAIYRTVFEQILDRRTAKIVWDSMKRKFCGNQKLKKSLLNALRREFEILEMKNDKSIKDYFARVMITSNKISSGEDMPDKKIVEKILRTCQSPISPRSSVCWPTRGGVSPSLLHVSILPDVSFFRLFNLFSSYFFIFQSNFSS